MNQRAAGFFCLRLNSDASTTLLKLSQHKLNTYFSQREGLLAASYRVGGTQNDFKHTLLYHSPVRRCSSLSFYYRFVAEYVAKHSKSDQPLTEAEVLGRYVEFILQ